MVGSEPPFDRLIPGDIAIVCERTTNAWLAGLEAAASARVDGAILERLRAFVMEYHNGAVNAAILTRMLDENLKPGHTMRAQRYDSLKELAVQRVRSGLMPNQGSEINSLIELHSQGANQAAPALERLMFLRKLSNWPPNVQPISVEQCRKLFQIRDCFNSASDDVLRTLITIQLVMENAATAVSAAHSFLENLGRVDGDWDVGFGNDLRTSGFGDILIFGSGETVLGVILLLRVAPGTSGQITISLNKASGERMGIVTRDLKTVMYMVPFLTTFDVPIKLDWSDPYFLRVNTENASGPVHILGVTGRDARRNGPQERKTYYALVADKDEAG